MTIVVAAGLLPAIILLIYVYKMDRVEKEPVGLILKLVIFGAICTVPAGILERIFMPAAGAAAAAGVCPGEQSGQ